MGSELSMQSRAEITAKYARAYAKSSKKERGRLLDEVVAVTGWSQDNARRRLAQAAKPCPRAVAKARKPRGRKYSYDATKVLQRVWAFSGGECGKYLAASMTILLDALERRDDRPISGPGPRAGPAARADEHAPVAAAALFDHCPQSR